MKESKRIQLSQKKSGLLSKLKKGNLVKLLLSNVTTMGINLISIGPRVILRSAFQLMRANIWTRIISTFVLVAFDLFNYFRKKISRKQLVINMILSGMLLVGGTTGWVFGTNTASGIVAENTALWIVAGIIGAGTFGSVFNVVGRKILSKFFGSDMEDMIELINQEFEEMARKHSLDEKKTEEILKKIYVDDKICFECFCKKDKKKYARELLEPYFRDV